jgi:hypothetical protein
MSFVEKTRFVVRRAGHGFCDISGTPVAKPVVYLVPIDYFRSAISGKLAPGLTTHSFDDYFGQHFSVNCEAKSDGTYLFSTGNPAKW